MDIEMVRRFLALRKEKARIAQELEETKEVLRWHEEALIEALAAEGVDKITVDGRTVYPQRTFRPSLIDKQAAIAVLKQLPGWAYMVVETVNAQTLRGRVLELVRDGMVDNDDMPVLPDSLKELVNLNEMYSLSDRKA
ncbi:MAG TPA: hypothetical protein VM223_18095 [Planctomycetota bacterium]|nr:hypothetical protein [Planctomycetota bacterium]HUW33525.1 hypothetical protein [Planctomycetota bacterium]